MDEVFKQVKKMNDIKKDSYAQGLKDGLSYLDDVEVQLEKIIQKWVHSDETIVNDVYKVLEYVRKKKGAKS